VEAVLSSHPLVRLSAVVAVPDALKGELAVACIVPQADAKLTEEMLLSFCKERLSSYKVPRRIDPKNGG